MGRSRMSRVLIGVIVSCFVAGTFMVGGDADAQRRRRRRRAQQERPVETPHSDAIAPALGEVRWGWTRDQLMEHFTTKIREAYQTRINRAAGAIEEDQLIHERDVKIRQLRRGYVRFDGTTSGYDSGFLRNEFTHNNRESMVRVRTENAEDFYFFIRGRLWKWYRAFDASVFSGADFEQFSQALQGRFGEGRTRRERTNGHTEQWVEWQDTDSRLRAVDQTRFYGFYCLVFESKTVLSQLDQLRTNEDNRNQRRTHSIVDAVTSGNDTGAGRNSDIVDRITGRTPTTMGERRPANNDRASNDRGNDRAGDSGMGSSMGSSRTIDPIDDPLAGLD